MNYDCIIIGGGISALTCGIRCQEEGLRCALISAGMSALHFSSGSLDLLGYDETRKVIYEPFEYLERLIEARPAHPYARCGAARVREALFFIKNQLQEEGLELYHNESSNHFHVSALGTLKPTFFSQAGVFNENIKRAFGRKAKIAVINFEGYRDFYPDLAITNLKSNALFRDIEVVTGKILFPDYGDPDRNPFEFRSVDVARIFDTEEYLEDIADQIKKLAGDAGFAAMPAFIGITNYRKHHHLLQELTGMLIYEIPTLPPSILGMRIDNALKSRFAALGGVFIAGDRVTGGEIRENALAHINTENYGAAGLSARCFVLATGSFFSGGLVSDANSIREPVFGLRVRHDPERASWHSPLFFDRGSHPFLEYGVETDARLNPIAGDGNAVGNLFCTGALLSGYNPLLEGSGGGVAISTGYRAAESILASRGGAS